jgi:hypothetical protein
VVEVLILDAEALNALARASERSVLEDRARAILQVAYEAIKQPRSQIQIQRQRWIQRQIRRSTPQVTSVASPIAA